jgi:hypothetical protein
MYTVVVMRFVKKGKDLAFPEKQKYEKEVEVEKVMKE